MRILHVYKSYYPEDYGGVPQAIRHLVTGCAAEYGINAEVFTFSPNAGDHPTEFEGQRVTQAKTVLEVASTPLSIDAFSKFRNIASKCDLVHYHYPYPFADLLHLFCGRHIPQYCHISFRYSAATFFEISLLSDTNSFFTFG